jgi:tellurite resistance protein TehA-like permease
VSILLHNLPYNGIWLYWISVITFALNVFLFIVFLVISILRYTIYPQIWFAMIRHPAQSLFLGTFPMGLATIVNMIVFVCIPAWGTWAIYLVSSALLCFGLLCLALRKRFSLTLSGLGTVVAGRRDFRCYLFLFALRYVGTTLISRRSFYFQTRLRQLTFGQHVFP